ncbi:GntP family permease [Corynebacterium epidermidicanis]|uniref:H+/gluconate symporter family protein n=1 Tax=Corynebacterium epidermidicanis TaxID=1050174 RepID=A0A0G3GTX6_9CORY|nr:GntP family permease [Corynebacterium epidermidicanis]AKK02292.1 H+/gluconate symporter family protein [Corynebacterium epidermidicanis]
MVVPMIGIFLSLVVLIVLAYRGHSVVIAAPIAALLATLLSGAPLLATYTQIFMPALGKFITNFFPLFLTGAVFGRLMTVSGLAHDLAVGISKLFGPKRALLSTVLATALLTYGGVSAWVVAFTIVPIATALFQEAEIPKRLMPAAIAFGTITFAIAALPGSPQVHNVIPTKYFGTTSYAAPLIGLSGTALMLVLGMLWLEYRVRALHRAGERYMPLDGVHADATAALSALEEEEGGHSEVPAHRTAGNTAVRGLLGLLPIVVVVVMNYSFIYLISKRLDFSYLAEEKFGKVSLDSVVGTWSVTVALATAILVIFAMRPGMFGAFVQALSDGAKTAILPVFTTASEVGYGAVIASLAAFTMIRNGVFSISDNALVVAVVSTGVISGITGSSAGGLSMTLQTFGSDLARMATEQGISLEAMHRITAMASVSFDSLPHNGAVLTMLLVCGMTHKQSYKDVAVCTVVVPIIVVSILLAAVSIV